jgi:hypothetical protein
MMLIASHQFEEGVLEVFECHGILDRSCTCRPSEMASLSSYALTFQQARNCTGLDMANKMNGENFKLRVGDLCYSFRTVRILQANQKNSHQ